MKSLRLLVFTSALALAACHQPTAQQTPPPSEEQEVERRVQQRLAEEHRAEDERRAQEREQQLNAREQQLAAREQQWQAQQAAAAAPAPPQERPPQPPVPAYASEPAPPHGVDSYQIFYDALAPYGTWVELENYGYVWQPRATVQSARWQPYTVGRWAHTDYGYTWISKEPFGWATYHYGRWTHLRRLGWVWIPGQEWGPAWVSWRYGDRYVGWAPLPPEARWDKARGIREWADEQYSIATEDYAFVPATEFGDDDLARASVPPEQNAGVIGDTVNVTNIVQNNAFIVNIGPDFAAIRARSRQPISELRVERRPAVRGGVNTAEVRGQIVDFAAPDIRPVDHGARPQQLAPRTADMKLHIEHAPDKGARPGATPELSVVPPAVARSIPELHRPLVIETTPIPAAALPRAQQLESVHQQQENARRAAAAQIPVVRPAVSVTPAGPLPQMPAIQKAPATQARQHEKVHDVEQTPGPVPAAGEQIPPTAHLPRRTVPEPPTTVSEPPENPGHRITNETQKAVPAAPPKTPREHRPVAIPNAAPEVSPR